MRASMIHNLQAGFLALCIGTTSLAAATAPSNDDLKALRYYLQQGDQSAAQAELSRLRQTFPDWTPPSDPSKIEPPATPGKEVDKIYQMIADGQLEKAQTTIRETQSRFPDWVPPEDMRKLLATGLAQRAFDVEVTRDPETADKIARSAPMLTACDRINNVWRLAAAQAKAGDRDRARGAYQSIIETCPKYSDIVASLQKADSVTDLSQLDALFDTAFSRFPAEKANLEALQKSLHDGHGRSTPSAGKTIRQAGTLSAKPATAGSPSVTSAGAPLRIAPTTWDNLPVSGDPRLSQMRRAKDAGAWAQCLAMTPSPRSLDLLNERGWCSLNLDRPMEALNSFSAAAKGRVSAKVARDARFGMAMSYLALKMSNEAAKIAAATNFTHKQRLDVESGILTQRAEAAYARKDYGRTVGYVDALEKLRGGVDRGMGLLRAYAYLDSGNKQKANELFQTMHMQMTDNATREGITASLGGE